MAKQDARSDPRAYQDRMQEIHNLLWRIKQWVTASEVGRELGVSTVHARRLLVAAVEEGIARRCEVQTPRALPTFFYKLANGPDGDNEWSGEDVQDITAHSTQDEFPW